MTEKKKLFIGYCWGAAGSSWLARLLNSHEDIFSLHAPIFPRFDSRSRKYEDVVEVIDAVLNTKALGGTYPVVGFTHAIQIHWHAELSERYRDQLRGFVLIRHPISRIQSNFALHKKANPRRISDKFWKKPFKSTYKELTRQVGNHFPDDFDSLGFYWSCSLVSSIVSEYRWNLPIYKLEDLVSQKEIVNKLAAYISDGTCQFSDDVIARVQHKVVNAHAQEKCSIAEIYGAWSEPHKEAYHYLVKPEAFQIYKELGYEFPHPV
ncbi:MAG: hypothetical protein GY797_29175 [Deltaproteobacteria bacterium]|nr:hypothetical protein [Deltaproteobacteria bacterium]